jgi:hypothetical protein
MNKPFIAVAVLAIALFSISGCKKKAENAEGPMESAGEEVDQAAETTENNTEEAVEEAGDNVEEATD